MCSPVPLGVRVQQAPLHFTLQSPPTTPVRLRRGRPSGRSPGSWGFREVMERPPGRRLALCGLAQLMRPAMPGISCVHQHQSAIVPKTPPHKLQGSTRWSPRRRGPSPGAGRGDPGDQASCDGSRDASGSGVGGEDLADQRNAGTVGEMDVAGRVQYHEVSPRPEPQVTHVVEPQ
jgi:hypothetical protein